MINKSRLIKLTQNLLQIESVNPPGNEEKIAEFIVRNLKPLGLDLRVIRYAKGRPNVIATFKGQWPRKKAKEHAVLITPHIDTVPIGTGWKFDPFGGKLHKGKIYGRGASDDKGNLACCMEVLRSLVEDKVKLNKDVVMAATADEETGSHMGILPLLEKGVLRPKLALITDSEENDTIVSQKGLLHSRIQIFGRKAHGAYNWLGINAIEIAAGIISDLKKHKFPSQKHPRLHAPTVNIGTIRGGDKVNMVSDFCEFSVDIRYMPGTKPKEIMDQIKSLVKRRTSNFKYIVDDSQLPYEMDPKHPYVKTYLKAAADMGIKAKLKGSEGATVITFFQKYGIPAFSTGYGARGTMHANDEYAEVKTLYKGSQLLEEYIKRYDLL